MTSALICRFTVAMGFRDPQLSNQLLLAGIPLRDSLAQVSSGSATA
jgi:hypothetical protein